MDAPSKFFFCLEKKNGQKRLVQALQSEEGQVLLNPSDIRKRAVGFYKNLYRSEYATEADVESTFLRSLPKMSEEGNAALSGVLSLGELNKALQGMELGKAPGIDGLPIDFYKSFWAELGEDLLQVLSDSLSKGMLPLSCRRAVTTLIPKKGDLTDIKNWRPVSLLCCDYKLLSKVLANRLAEVISQVIHPDQSYCVPRRSIVDNISLIRDALEVSKLLNLDFGLISLDQEKAFDRVEHLYLWKTLEAFGFKQDFIKMVQVLYSEVESVLKINGGLCAPFQVKRGVRQGCALSGMLYSLAIEPLLQQLREKIKGLHLPDCKITKNVCLSAYADDVIVFVSGQKDVHSLFNVINDFTLVSSAKVNWKKCETLLVGKWNNGKPKLPEGLVWGKGGLKYLGVFLGDDLTQQKNWEGIVEKIKGRLEKWKWLLSRMSYRGRILVINNLVASSLWHKLACIDPPPQLLGKIQAILVDFFWDRLHWVQKSILFLPKDEGGQGLVHLQSRMAAFRLQFLKRLLDGAADVSWRAIAHIILQNYGGFGLDKHLFLLNPLKMDLSVFPPFYKSLFKVWGLFHIQKSESPYSLHWLLEEPLVLGARLDATDDNSFFNWGSKLKESKVIILRQLLDLAGENLDNAEMVASFLGTRSIRLVSLFLMNLKSIFTAEESLMIKEYFSGASVPDEKDFFPCLMLSPKLEGFKGSLLKMWDLKWLDLLSTKGNVLYRGCVIAFNKNQLAMKSDTPWRSFFGLKDNVKPEWRVIYKPPLSKKVGDLQWRILHGILAVNSFVSKLNVEVKDDCPFCFQRETIFHVFIQCSRLTPFFDFVK